MPSEPIANLVEVLTCVRHLLLLPDNEFVYSAWDNAEAAIRDIDGFIQTMTEGRLPSRTELSILFAPTGSIQEVSIRSGWGVEFLLVAEAFDRAEERAYGRAAAG